MELDSTQSYYHCKLAGNGGKNPAMTWNLISKYLMTESNFSILWRLPALNQGPRTFNKHLTGWIFNFMLFHADHHYTKEWINFFTSSYKIIFLLNLNEWVSNMQSFLHTFKVTDIMEKNFLSNPLKSTNQKIDFLCIEKLL